MPSVFKYNGNEIIDSSGKITAAAMNSSGDAPVYACRAWVSFDGTKDTSGNASTSNTNRLIHASGNVASVLRNGTGSYTITFTTEMPNVNYVTTGMCGNDGDSATSHTVMFGAGSSRTTSAVRFTTMRVTASTATLADEEIVNIACFR